MEKFRVEYEKLHRALKKSHESEKRLVKRCKELNGEIVSNASKVQTALKLSQEDQKTIASLNKEIEKAWKMVDASHEKETQANHTIQQLKQEITNLTKLVEQGTGLSIEHDHSLNKLIQTKSELTKGACTLLVAHSCPPVNSSVLFSSVFRFFYRARPDVAADCATPHGDR